MQVELLSEAAELIVETHGTHPAYKCLIVIQPKNICADWTDKSRDEVMERMSGYVSAHTLSAVALLVLCRSVLTGCLAVHKHCQHLQLFV